MWQTCTNKVYSAFLEEIASMEGKLCLHDHFQLSSRILSRMDCLGKCFKSSMCAMSF